MRSVTTTVVQAAAAARARTREATAGRRFGKTDMDVGKRHVLETIKLLGGEDGIEAGIYERQFRGVTRGSSY